MPRRKMKGPPDFARVTLRVREDFHRRLQAAADEHKMSLNSEITLRLEDSFSTAAKTSLINVAMSLVENWMRFESRFLRLTLEEQLIEEILTTDDIERIRSTARMWLSGRGTEQLRFRKWLGEEHSS